MRGLELLRNSWGYDNENYVQLGMRRIKHNIIHGFLRDYFLVGQAASDVRILLHLFTQISGQTFGHD